VFEIKLIDPILLVVEITGTDPRFKKPVRGQYLGSFVGFDRCNTRIGCITREGKMCLGFRDGQLETSPIMSARVYGDNWSYPVF
jgi:hypothetical protein